MRKTGERMPAANSWVVLLGVQVPLQVFSCHLRFHARGRDFDLGGPENRVEHQLPDIVVSPIPMVVPAGEPESAPSVRAFTGPGDDLRLPALDRLAHHRVAFVRAI